ncbi:MAG: hypothetical protein HKN78_02995 [Sphingomonadaceae bacterium]|nr:hypothetical protein [Sphingomonadaceae bacterium]
MLLAMPLAAQGEADVFDMAPVDGRRVALVIGNSNYNQGSSWAALDNAADDARYMADTLSDPARGDAQFETVLLTDATLEQTLAALRRFAETAENADIALVYYAGHGFQHGGENYIAPVDAPGRISDDAIAQHYVSMTEMIAAAYTRGLTIFVLDACRTPGAVVTVRRDGSAITPPPFGAVDAPDAVILYATASGNGAYDAAPPGAPLSPFATAMARAVSQPGLDIPYVFNAVHQTVRLATEIFEPDQPAQRPVFTGSYSRRFFFIPPDMEDFVPTETAAVEVAEAGSAPVVQRGASDAEILGITDRELATIDENNLVGRIFARHTMPSLRALADGGNPVAMSMLGYLLSYDQPPAEGDFSGERLAEAQRWLERGAATGHPAPQLEYGHFLIVHGTEENRPQAIELVERSADQGFAKAQSYLYSAIQRGLVPGRTAPESIGLLREASERGHGWASYALLFESEPFEPHLARLQALAEAGDVEGHSWLCRASERAYIAARGIVIDNAFDHCLAAANGNYTDAQAITAARYAEGRGVAANAERAHFWARLAEGAHYLDPVFRPRVEAILAED